MTKDGEIESLKNRLKRYNDKFEEQTGNAIGLVASVTGGLIAGGLAAKFPVIPKTRLRTDVAISIGTTIAAGMGAGGKHNSAVWALANGLGSGTAATMAYRRLLAPPAAA